MVFFQAPRFRSTQNTNIQMQVRAGDVDTSPHVRLVVVEGNISAGKSTLCRSLADELGYELFLENGEKYLDITSGFSGHAIIGWGNKDVINSITKQLQKIGHIDYKMFSDPNREEFADLLINQCVL